jgi:hypothetical protein
MAHDLTEASTYTANVTVPDDGDALSAASVEAPFQDVADRTKYLKAHVDALEAANVYGRYTVSGSPGSGANFTLAQVAANGPTLAANEITISQTGLYMIALTCQMSRNIADDGAGTADGAFVVMDLYADAVAVASARTRRFVDEVGIAVQVNASVVVALTAGQKITVKASVADLVTPGTSAESRVLSVGRIA